MEGNYGISIAKWLYKFAL